MLHLGQKTHCCGDIYFHSGRVEHEGLTSCLLQTVNRPNLCQDKINLNPNRTSGGCVRACVHVCVVNVKSVGKKNVNLSFFEAN